MSGLRSLSATLGFLFLIHPVLAQQQKPVNQEVIVLTNNKVKLPAPTKKPIIKVELQNHAVARVHNAKTGVVIHGVKAGKSNLVLTDSEGLAVTYDLVVRSDAFYLSVGVTKPLRLSDRRRIKKVITEKPGVAIVSAVPNDPTVVLVTGVAAGVTRITLISEDGRTEVRSSGGVKKK